MDYPFGVCSVCGAPATGNHYGAVTCEACKGFFKRGQATDNLRQVPAWQIYRCYEGGDCQIDVKARTRCKKCRYDKCVQMGMTLEGLSAKGKSAASIPVKRLMIPTAARSQLSRRRSHGTFHSPEAFSNLQQRAHNMIVPPRSRSAEYHYCTQSPQYGSLSMTEIFQGETDFTDQTAGSPRSEQHNHGSSREGKAYEWPPYNLSAEISPPVYSVTRPHESPQDDRLFGNPHLISNVSVIVYRDQS